MTKNSHPVLKIVEIAEGEHCCEHVPSPVVANTFRLGKMIVLLLPAHSGWKRGGTKEANMLLVHLFTLAMHCYLHLLLSHTS